MSNHNITIKARICLNFCLYVCFFFSRDENRIILTVNHLKDTKREVRSVAPNFTKSPINSNNKTSNSSYANKHSTSKGSPEKVCFPRSEMKFNLNHIMIAKM